MAFDPTKPQALTEVDANFLRDQFNALKALIDAQGAQILALQAQVTALQSALNGKASMDQVNAAIVANSSANVDNMEPPSGYPSDPPTKDDVLMLLYFSTNLLNAMKRQS